MLYSRSSSLIVSSRPTIRYVDVFYPQHNLEFSLKVPAHGPLNRDMRVNSLLEALFILSTQTITSEVPRGMKRVWLYTRGSFGDDIPTFILDSELSGKTLLERDCWRISSHEFGYRCNDYETAKHIAEYLAPNVFRADDSGRGGVK